MCMISIVMPVYNGEKFLKQSIESVIGQSYKDWELILVNDCSTDNSLEIMQSYAESDNRIKIISNEINKKLPKSLNVGFTQACGKYYTWTSDDNMFHKDAIREMCEYLDKNPDVGMVYADMEYIDENGDIVGYQRINPEEIYLRNCVGACFMYRSSVAAEVGEYNPDCFLVEDYDYWFRINRKYLLRRINKVLYSYRKHPGSLTETRQAMISEQLFKLRIKEYPYFDGKIAEDMKEKLFLQMYFENVEKREGILDIFWKNKILPQQLMWIGRERKFDSSKKIILFGAGNYGRKALTYFGEENVEFFCDNNSNLVGKKICNKEVLPYNKLKDMEYEYQIVISVSDSIVPEIVGQFERDEIKNYCTYSECVAERNENVYNK